MRVVDQGTYKSEFHKNHSFEKMKSESEKMLNKHPDRIPVIIQLKNSINDCKLDKNKYLVPKDLPLNQLVNVVRKRIKLSPERGIYILIENDIPSQMTTMVELYDKYKEDNGFLFIYVMEENCFG